MLTSGSELRDPFWWGLQDNMECGFGTWVGLKQSKCSPPSSAILIFIYVLSFVCHTQWYPAVTPALYSVKTPGMLGIELTLAVYKANA